MHFSKQAISVLFIAGSVAGAGVISLSLAGCCSDGVTQTVGGSAPGVYDFYSPPPTQRSSDNRKSADSSPSTSGSATTPDHPAPRHGPVF